MLLPTLPSCLNLHTFQESLFQILVSHIHAPERPMRRIEFVRLNSPPDLENLRWRQRDHIWNRPQERVAGLTRWTRVGCICRLHGNVSMLSSRTGLYRPKENAYRDSDNSIGDEELFLPVQDQAAGEVSTSLNSGHARQNLFTRASRATDHVQPLRRRRLLTEQFVVVHGYIDRTVESLSPSCVSGVVMWMGDDDGFYAAF